jgi:hypothetical protein
MIYGLDCLNAPSDTQGRLMLRLGWEFLNVYVGGPYLSGHTPWPAERIAALSALGFRFLPLYVGQQSTAGMTGTLTFDQGVIDGAEAVALTTTAGLAFRADGAPQIIGLDLEAGNYEHDHAGSRAYIEGFASVVNGAGHQFVLYSDPITAAELGTPDLVDLTRVSCPIALGRNYRRAPVGLFDPATPPAWNAWQFAFGATIAGVNCDLNSAVDSFPLAVYSA